MSRSDPRNARLLHAGEKLVGHIAQQVTNAVKGIDEHLARLDGYGGGGSDDPHTKTSQADDLTQRTAMRRLALLELREQLRDSITEATDAVDNVGHIATLCLKGTQEEPDAEPALCRDNQHGRDGVIEWGDPLCGRLPTKGKLCGACYMRSHRWKIAHGVDTSKDFAA